MEPSSFKNGHIDTIFPVLFRTKPKVNYIRERIQTPDEDFIDLDWVFRGSENLILLSHGFEGSSGSQYILGMAKYFSDKNKDILAWNFRSCSGQMNTQARFYHSGATDDLKLVIQAALSKRKYKNIYLIGFSMGGNITLKYLGENAGQTPEQIKASVCFSVPIDLASAAKELEKGVGRYIYTPNFLNTLKPKVKKKLPILNRLGIDTAKALKAKTLRDFDDSITGPLHGFKDASHYYQTQSSKLVLDKVAIPSLLINAKNDPFLGEECYPKTLEKHPYLQIETPNYGGHVGFFQFKSPNVYWSEERAYRFLKDK